MKEKNCFYSVNGFYSVFSPNTGKYGPEIARYLDTFHAVELKAKAISVQKPVPKRYQISKMGRFF